MFARSLIILAIVVTACGPANGDIDRLRRLPEWSLTYPNSVEITDGGANAEMTFDGSQSAFAWRWLGVDASAGEVERYFADELASRGWADGGGSSGISTTGEFSARAWHKDSLVFRLGFLNPKQRTDPERLEQYVTVYDARLIQRASK
jgi:hypothetical protein